MELFKKNNININEMTHVIKSNLAKFGLLKQAEMLNKHITTTLNNCTQSNPSLSLMGRRRRRKPHKHTKKKKHFGGMLEEDSVFFGLSVIFFIFSETLISPLIFPPSFICKL